MSPEAANAPILEICLSFALYNTSTTLGPKTALACRPARKPDDSSYVARLSKNGGRDEIRWDETAIFRKIFEQFRSRDG